MATRLLEDWCRGMGLDAHRALLVSGIPEDCGQAELEETLNAVLLPLGPYHVLNKIFLREDGAKAALVELGEGVSVRDVPREFPGPGGVWKVTCRDPTQDAEFLKNLNDFLDAEGRTWEDVVRLLQLNQAPRPPQQPPENWVEVLGGMLGAVVQVVFYMDSEFRKREEAKAREALEIYNQAQAVAAAAIAARNRIKKEPRPAAEGGSAPKENAPVWSSAGVEPRPPRPLMRRAGAKSRSRRKKQKKKPKEEPEVWKKVAGNQPSSSPSLEEAAPVDEAEDPQPPESVESSTKPQVKQEGSAAKKPTATCGWKGPSSPTRGAQPRAESPRASSEPEGDGGQEGPPKKKAMGWASTKSTTSKKKKKVNLVPISYVLQGSEDAQKLATPNKGPGSSKVTSVQKASPSPQPPESPTSSESPASPASVASPASTAQEPEEKPEGSPPDSEAPKEQ